MNVAYWLYLLVLVFAPLAFGTTELWSLVTVEVLTGVAAAALFVTTLLRRERLFEVPGLLPLLLLLVFMVVQIVPLPAALVKLIAPASYDAYAPLLAVGESDWIPLTINRKGTLQELFRIGSYALIYISTIQLLSTHARLKRTLSVIIWLAAAVAFFAIIHQVTSPGTLFWLRPAPANTTTFGPWVNQNQYAGFMEMLSPLAIALFLFYKPRIDRGESVREKIVSFFTMAGGNLHIFYGLAAVIITMSVFVSLCRGGILTISVSVLIFMLLYNLKKPQQGRGAVVLIIFCILVTVSWFGWDTVIAEFNRGVNAEGELSDGRFDQWRDTILLIRTFLLFGSGFGTYVDAYPSFKTIPVDAIFDHVHNDYLELFADGGIIGFALAAWFVLAVIRHGWQKIRARRDQYASLLGIGALTGIVAMLLHSITDFNMHNGADGLYFFLLCGLLVAAVNSRFSAYDARTLLKEQSGKRTPAYAAAVMLFVAVICIVEYRTILAGVIYGGVKDIYVSKHLREDKRQALIAGAQRAEKLDPLEQRYSNKLASLAWNSGDREGARKKYFDAARKNPMTGDALQWLGLLSEDEETAKILVEKGYQRAINKDELALTYAEYLLWKGDRQRAITVMAEQVGRRSSLLKKWTAVMENYSFTADEIRAALPPTPDAWIAYGDYLQQVGNLDGSEFYRSTALSFITAGLEIRPHWFQQLIQFYHATARPKRALAVLREAVEKVPTHASFHVQLGDSLWMEGISYRAEEEYKRALMLEPGNAAAKRGLRRMGLLDAY